jgi:multicomponent Na+:H+ antiporter subunit G
MSSVAVSVLLLAGAGFLLLAAVGLLRMPDLLTRMHPASKSATLGVMCVVLGVAVYYGDLGVTTRALLVVLFFFLTAPVAAHLIGRAAYRDGIPVWEGTVIDELRGRYHGDTHTLDGHEGPASPGGGG